MNSRFLFNFFQRIWICNLTFLYEGFYCIDILYLSHYLGNKKLEKRTVNILYFYKGDFFDIIVFEINNKVKILKKYNKFVFHL